MSLINKKIDNKGFTLVELAIGMFIMAMIGLGLYWLVATGIRNNAVIFRQLDTQNDARQVLNDITNIIRRAETSSIGSYPIELADDYEVVIYANIDSDSFRERIRFWVSGTDLYRGITELSTNPLSYDSGNEVSEIIAKYVVNQDQGVPVFTYYNENYTGVESPLDTPANLTQVRVVRVQIEIEENPEESPVPLHVEATVNLRNLKTN